MEGLITDVLELAQSGELIGADDYDAVDLADADGIFVADDGPGIPERERDSVFEPGHTTKHAGTGYGLATVKQLVESHDWTIRITESDTGGARFEITGIDFAAED